MIAAEFGTGQVLWSIIWFFLFVVWFWLLITIFADIMRARELSGWGKALWAIGIIVLPIFGVLLYLIVNGSKMNQRAEDDARAAEEAAKAYIRETASSGSPAEELSKLAALHEDGTLDDDEYERGKARVVG